ncbi:MAG: hypothetical protein WCH10_02925 [bacterium]
MLLEPKGSGVDIKNALDAIEASCKKVIDDIQTTTSEQQQESYNAIKKQKFEFAKLLADYQTNDLIAPADAYSCMEKLIEITYDLDKIASRQSFGITEQPKDLPKDYITINQLKYEKGGAVSSANAVVCARLQDETKAFCKDTKSEIAQLEILLAEFFRQTLGNSHTSHGKIIVDGDKIKGMYVEAIPGFVSIRQLTDWAKDPQAFERANAKVEEDIKSIQKEIATKNNNDSDATLLITKLQEKIKLHAVYTQIEKEQLINTQQKTVNVDKLSKIMAKTLCSAFYYEDWDRHKDNLGVSYSHKGGLGAASLDYDKSLTGVFHQDNKLYDWNITPERLRDFPNFDCWYWPTQSHALRE